MTRTCWIVALLCAGLPGLSAPAQVFVGLEHYFSANNSPIFADLGTAGFFLEDFEDLVVDVPGVSLSAGGVLKPGRKTDSVDGDDGKIDGLGRAGHSWHWKGGPRGITIAFDEAVLGNLPAFAGIVWTDGSSSSRVTFEAFDPAGDLLVRQVLQPVGGRRPRGGTVEDRLLAAACEAGISAIRITSNRGGLELDHLQFGPQPAAVPEPASVALLALGGALLGRRRWR